MSGSKGRTPWSAAGALAVLSLALLTACHRTPRPPVERIAVLRFENLGADPSNDWMGRAFSEVITSELEGAPGIYAVSAGRLHAIDAGFGRRPAGAPGISAERAAALAAGATEIGYGQYMLRNGVVQARLTVEDTLTGKMTSLKSVQAPAADVLSAATTLALQISPRISPYGTRNAQVLQAHVQAIEGLAAADLAESLQKAIAADPNFGPAYRQLALFKAQQRDPAGALALLDQALARGSAIGDAERARLQLQSAVLRNDAAGRLQALAALAKADPNDPQTWRDLAVFAVATHQYQPAVGAFRKSLAIQPDDADAWNQLGYAAAYAGDFATASNALVRYQNLLPASPNPLDSLGDVNLIAGHLREAENYYLQGAKMNPAFFAGLDFLKAAMAHLMTGDVAGADSVAQQYFDARAAAKDPLVDYRKAQWSWISGRRKAACRQMEQLAHDSEAASSREVAAHAYAELAVWNLMLGNRETAAEVSKKAVALAMPSSATPAILARFLAQAPASAAEWQARANQLAPNPDQAPIRSFTLATALLTAKEYAAAAPVLQQMYDTGSAAADEGIQVLLAWADLETGRVPEAAALLRSNQPLADIGLSWSTPLHFPRIFYLRAVAAEEQGKPDEARENFRLFHQLSGPDPLMWGEEQKAK
jgi:tetratricopeptide (TPR) repeat protein